MAEAEANKQCQCYEADDKKWSRCQSVLETSINIFAEIYDIRHHAFGRRISH